MPTQNQYQIISLEAPFGGSTELLAAEDLARQVINLKRTPDRTLVSVRGPCPYEPDRGEGYFPFGRMHGVFHQRLQGERCPMVLVRAGTILYRHDGSNRTYEAIVTGLSDDTTLRQADCFTVVGNQVIWSNGIDRPKSITYDGVALPLGYDRSPGAPWSEGPSQPPSADSDDDETRDKHFPNSLGYSHPGKIGTLGDVRSPTEGSLLGGSWAYYIQDEDFRGNLSPLSPSSDIIEIYPQSTQEVVGGTTMLEVTVDDLPRQFFVRCSGDAQPHTKKRHIARTRDMRNYGIEPRHLSSDPGATKTPFPDRRADSELGDVMLQPLPVPVFHISFAWGDRLCILVGGEVWISMKGRYGTFLPENRFSITTGGAELIAGASFGGRVYVWTRRGTYDITGVLEGAPPVQVSKMVGCAAHATVQGLPDGRLCWLSWGGFYTMQPGGVPEPASRDIHTRVTQEMSRGAFPQAVAATDYDADTGEYRCAVTPAGSKGNTVIFAFDGRFWREYQLGIEVNAMCVTDDDRNYTLMAGRDTSADFKEIFVFDHEYEEYSPPARTCLLWSREITAGGESYGRGSHLKMHVTAILVGFVDAYAGDLTVKTYANGGRAPHETFTDVQSIGLDSDSNDDHGGFGIAQEVFGSAELGTVKAREPRLFWRTIEVDCPDVHTFSFSVECDHPVEMEIRAIRVVASPHVTAGANQGRAPEHNEVDES